MDGGTAMPHDGGTRDTSAPFDAQPCPAPHLSIYVPPTTQPDCQPLSCASFDRACGMVSDGCEHLLDCGPCSEPTVRQLDTPLNDLEWDASRGVLYGSVPSTGGPMANSVVTIDPRSATVVHSVFVGSQPNPLALSANGNLLYVGLDGSGTVRAIDLQTGAVGAPFFVGDAGLGGESLRAMDLAVLPDRPSAVAVVRASSTSTSIRGVSVFANGVMLPIATPPFFSIVNALAFDGPGVLLGINSVDTGGDFSVLSVCASGVSLAGTTPSVVESFRHELRVEGGLAFHGSRVIDPATRARIGQYDIPSPDGVPDFFAMVPDSVTHRTYAITAPRSTSGAPSLLAFDRERFRMLDSVAIASPLGVPQEASSCGSGCLAVLTTGASGTASRLAVIRTALITTLRGH